MPYYEGNENVIIYMSTIGMPYMYEDNRIAIPKCGRQKFHYLYEDKRNAINV